MMKLIYKFYFILFYLNFLFSYEKENDFIFDLEKTLNIRNSNKDNLPFLYNYTSQVGYFLMPSARVNDEGVIAFTYAKVNPYDIYSGYFQFLSRLELSLNYYIFKGIKEGTFGHMGYGDDAERAANFKIAILKKNDFGSLPEIAIGINDFMGSKRFNSKYIVFTKQFLDLNFEMTLGYSVGRIKGFFSGLAYTPFRKKDFFLNNLSFAVELDKNNYKKNIFEHPKSKKVNFPVNFGMHLKPFNILDIAVSSIRGRKIASSITANYNLGESKGLFPKYLDPLYYKAPKNTEKISVDRSYLDMSIDLAYALHENGFELIDTSYYLDDKDRKNLILKIINYKYRQKEILKKRIQDILVNLLAENIFTTTIYVESNGLLIEKFIYKSKDLEKFKEKKISNYELNVLSPIQDISKEKNKYELNEIYKKNKKLFIFTFRPRLNSYFGSTTGKFKFDSGLQTDIEGYFFDNIYYNLSTSYILKSSSSDVGSKDIYNPSQIINVRSDFIKYYQSNSFHLENFYFQKAYNLKNGYFSRVALGFFEIAYAGLAIEGIYYPANKNLSIGLEISSILKRKYSGIGFQKVRKLNNMQGTYEKFIGVQYFLNLNYELDPLKIIFKTSLGQFLAKDKGIKIEITKYFKSGTEVSIFSTFTNAKDIVNNKRYFDKGFMFSIPLDIFMNKSSKSRLNYSMSPWLRDVGAKAKTGNELYEIIHNERKM
ncbi:MAG: hypothetical protein K1060chlam5_00952 [Candidatus Anoxychlamydiales bacterium]|nr:hypothetical protein [Candidatus Anoxychlamydiales bacterium]